MKFFLFIFKLKWESDFFFFFFFIILLFFSRIIFFKKFVKIISEQNLTLLNQISKNLLFRLGKKKFLSEFSWAKFYLNLVIINITF